MNLAAYARKSVRVDQVPGEVVEVTEAFPCAVEGSGTAGFLPRSTKQRLQRPGPRLTTHCLLIRVRLPGHKVTEATLASSTWMAQASKKRVAVTCPGEVGTGEDADQSEEIQKYMLQRLSY